MTGWSSYSEVAAYWGGKGGKPMPILVAGRDFGAVVDSPAIATQPPPRKPKTDAEMDADFVRFVESQEHQESHPDRDEEDGRLVAEDGTKEDGAESLQRNWPKPFGNW